MRFLGESKNGFVISDPSDHGVSSVPLMHHDPKDLRSQNINPFQLDSPKKTHLQYQGEIHASVGDLQHPVKKTQMTKVKFVVLQRLREIRYV